MPTSSRMVAIVVGFCFFLMFLFVPETFWDRTPRPHEKSQHSAFKSLSDFFHHPHHEEKSRRSLVGDSDVEAGQNNPTSSAPDETSGGTIAERRLQKQSHHVGFADESGKEDSMTRMRTGEEDLSSRYRSPLRLTLSEPVNPDISAHEGRKPTPYPGPLIDPSPAKELDEPKDERRKSSATIVPHAPAETALALANDEEKMEIPQAQRYTNHLRTQPPKTFVQTLKPWNGQLRHENWFKVALRPFILFAYPAMLWSALIYSLSIGWLIVLSETVTEIYRNKDYTFSSLAVGLVYISPFVGGILGTAVAGRFSDLIVRAMSRKNGGVYEPEFRLVMAIPVALSTIIGLMGFGWSVSNSLVDDPPKERVS